MYNFFGVNNPSGSALLNLARDAEYITWGRKSPLNHYGRHITCDLANISLERLPSIDGIIISFAPIWLLASFLNLISSQKPKLLDNTRGIIACSSSSYQTKRYAFNLKDQELADSLNKSHLIIRSLCANHAIPCQILAPTLIYGKVNGYEDQNISKIIEILRKFPLIALPIKCGYRQPIHATQLAAIAWYQAFNLISEPSALKSEFILNVGGDDIISYDEMIIRVRDNLNSTDRGRNCKILHIPDTSFYALSAGLLLWNPKFFEGVMRIKSNLSGFTKSHEITKTKRLDFPILPLPNT